MILMDVQDNNYEKDDDASIGTQVEDERQD